MARRVEEARYSVPSSQRTPVTQSFSIKRETALPVFTVMRGSFKASSSVAATSAARSETGKTRFPRSVFKGRPRLSKNSMVSEGEKAWKAE